MGQNAPTKESLAADAFEMAQEVDDADEAALFLAFGDLLAALEGGGHGVFRADGHLPALHLERQGGAGGRDVQRRGAPITRGRFTSSWPVGKPQRTGMPSGT